MTSGVVDPEIRIREVRGFALTSPYGSGQVLGQPTAGKSLGFVEIVADGGAAGVGETYAGVYAPDLVAPIADFLSQFALGRAVAEREKIVEDIARLPFLGRNGLVRSVASAIEIGLWDLTGKLLGQPVHALLSKQARQRVPVYASGGSAAFSPEEIERDLASLLEAGHSAYKMRVGHQAWTADVERVQRARDVLGDGRALMVDAIMGTLRPPWHAEMAIARGRDLTDCQPYWLEEPVHPEDVAGLRRVREALPFPVATGEALSGRAEFEELLSPPSTDFIQPDVTHAGGLTPCVEIAERALAVGVRTAVHVWGSAVAFSANAQLALATNAVDILELPTVPLAIARDLWLEPPIIRDGHYHASSLPGLGVRLASELAAKYPFVPGSGFRL